MTAHLPGGREPAARALVAHDPPRRRRAAVRARARRRRSSARRGQIDLRPREHVGPTRDPAAALRDDGAAVVAWRACGEEGAVRRAHARSPAVRSRQEREVASRQAQSRLRHRLLGVLRPTVRPCVRAARQRPASASGPGAFGSRARCAGVDRAARDCPTPRSHPSSRSGTLDGRLRLPRRRSAARLAVFAGIHAALVLPGRRARRRLGRHTAHPRPASGAEHAGAPRPSGGRIHLARADDGGGPGGADHLRPGCAPRACSASTPRDPFIRVRVRCAAACDLRAFIHGTTAQRRPGPPRASRAGRSQLLRLYWAEASATARSRRPPRGVDRARPACRRPGASRRARCGCAYASPASRRSRSRPRSTPGRCGAAARSS